MRTDGQRDEYGDINVCVSVTFPYEYKNDNPTASDGNFVYMFEISQAG
jgi:hypothetical protein